LPLCAECHAFWHEKHPRLSLLLQIPPFEQMRLGMRRLRPRKYREELEQQSPGAIRTRKLQPK